MKFTTQWLRKFVNPDMGTQALCELLTRAGIEFETLSKAGPSMLKEVFIARIQSIEKHQWKPQLYVCQVATNNQHTWQIICGASNIYEGMKAPLVLAGSKLDKHTIDKTTIKGVTSQGMLCSEKELSLSDDNERLMTLPDNAPIGRSLFDYLELADDCIEVDLTPNRSDCLSIYGLAREVAALTNTPLTHHDIEPPLKAHNNNPTIKLSDASICPRYAGMLVKNLDPKAQTPLYIREKLRRVGLRSVSPCVDITNYVLMEIGQPLHAFDHDKLKGSITVRYAQPNETMTLLDETKINLDCHDIVVADEQKPIALAGVMGAKNSAIDENTRNILLESAHFPPLAMAGKARKHGLNTDASHRFERGVDPFLCHKGINQAAQLLYTISNGECGPVNDRIIDNNLYSRPTIEIDQKTITRILGITIDENKITDYLDRLSLNPVGIDKGKWRISVPSWRFDLNIKEDVVEEIARIYGYANIPLTYPSSQLPHIQVSDDKLSLDRIKQCLVDRGFYETINYSFIDQSLANWFDNQNPLALANPIAQDMGVMRQGLVPGLLKTFQTNLNRQSSRIRLFEEGLCFQGDQTENLLQRSHIAGLAYGYKHPLNWRSNDHVDFFDVKSDVEALLWDDQKRIIFEPLSTCAGLHPGQSATIYIEGEYAGFIGTIHPNLIKWLQLKTYPPFVFELLYDKISQQSVPTFSPISKYPAIARDLAIIVDDHISSRELINTVYKAQQSILKSVKIFDIYQGDQLSHKQKSVALNLIFQSSSKTLTEQEIHKVLDKIINDLKMKVGAKLRE